MGHYTWIYIGNYIDTCIETYTHILLYIYIYIYPPSHTLPEPPPCQITYLYMLTFSKLAYVRTCTQLLQWGTLSEALNSFFAIILGPFWGSRAHLGSKAYNVDAACISFRTCVPKVKMSDDSRVNTNIFFWRHVGYISDVFVCFSHVFRCAPRPSLFRCWCQTTSHARAFRRRFHGLMGWGWTCENRALVWLLTRFRGLQALPIRLFFQTFSWLLVRCHLKRHFIRC